VNNVQLYSQLNLSECKALKVRDYKIYMSERFVVDLINQLLKLDTKMLSINSDSTPRIYNNLTFLFLKTIILWKNVSSFEYITSKILIRFTSIQSQRSSDDLNIGLDNYCKNLEFRLEREI